MCFIIHPDCPKPLVAEQDIVCFKNGMVHWLGLSSPRLVFTSLFRGYTYEFQERQPEVKLKPNRYSIDEGYHSYSPNHYSMSSPSSLTHDVKCIIPKGSTYYYNPDLREYVSSSLIVLEIIH